MGVLNGLLAVALLVAPGPVPAGAAEKAAKADDKLELVQFFLKTPVSRLPAEAIGEFLAIDPKTVPAKLRDRFEVKRQELIGLKKIADGQMKPPVRRLNQPDQTDCEPPREMSMIGPMAQVGFVEIFEDESRRLMKDTECSECELRTEFSLTLVVTPAKKKGGKPILHYMLHGNDPLNALVAGYRGGTKPFGTNFFGIGNPKCH